MKNNYFFVVTKIDSFVTLLCFLNEILHWLFFLKKNIYSYNIKITAAIVFIIVFLFIPRRQ